MFPKVVVFLATLLVIYFGLRAIHDDSERSQDNPFEYNIDAFRQIDPALLHYDEVQQIELPFIEVGGIAIDSADNVSVSGDRSVTIFTSDGIPKSTFATPSTASCLAIDSDFNLFLGINGQIMVYDTSGVKQAQWDRPEEFGIFTSVAVTPAFVFVADAENLVIWKFDKSGQHLGRIGERNPDMDIPGLVIPTPYLDIAIDPEGYLWAGNTGRHQMENYTLDGDLRTSWGRASMQLDGFAGCCNPSHFAIMSDGEFVTSEKGIPRIKVYSFRGQLLSVVATPGQFDEGAEGLDLGIDSQDRIYVLDPMRRMIRIFSKKKGT
jgi:hypothetical protein